MRNQLTKTNLTAQEISFVFGRGGKKCADEEKTSFKKMVEFIAPFAADIAGVAICIGFFFGIAGCIRIQRGARQE